MSGRDVHVPARERFHWYCWWVTMRSGRLIVLAVLAFAVYALMWVGYALQWEWLDTVDSSSLEALHGYGIRHPGWVDFWYVFCAAFGPAAFRLLGVVVIVIALVRRNLRSALFVVISLELSGLVTQVAKELAERPRPGSALVYAPSSSFPSGHAVGVMIGVLTLCTVALPLLRPRLRLVTMVAGAVIVVAIGFGRVALNVHYPSDVVAGWALGYLYVVACLFMLRPSPLTAVVETPEAPGTGR